MITSIFKDGLGFLHLTSSILAMLFGTMIILLPKGTRKHIRLGYFYFCAMVMMLSTSFLIYRLTNSFNIFHYGSILTILVMAIGMFPVWFKRPKNSWKLLHYNFMYWSVVALYEAFFSEIFTRIPGTSFFQMVGLGIGLALVVGFVIFFRYRSKWEMEIGIRR